MQNPWLNLLGLIISLCGIIILAAGLIISRRQALKIGVSRMAEDEDQKNIHLPHVRDELRESRFAVLGLLLLVIGFLLQIIGNLPIF
ncbi:MAG: hypothetical protein KDH97_00175 [Calditrichaeota bacterium]|nr:hypothetical protein [Calditrichota bacterium]MCB0288650.1 hypothetical protein [Calditrichota bacterium]MCB0294120.1 hypothetical protein [Calditrichota bacterium]MCB0312286.1 hypothetical protein [Calditrichota bacterium]MCB9088598.1 hypothetical protein [Calditrichia bacterium]